MTVIGAVVHLSTQGKSKGYFLERILKKSTADLRSFFKELGLQEEPTKRRERETGTEVADIFVYFTGSAAAVAAAAKKRQQATTEEAEEAAEVEVE